jgi:hypothetical protein
MGWTRLAEIATIGSFGLALIFGLLQTWPQIRMWRMADWRAKLFVGFLVLGILFAGLQALGMPALLSYEWDQRPRTLIQGKAFRNQHVTLDGYAYKECIFENVTFIYKGESPFDFVSNKVIGSVFFYAEPKSIAIFLDFLRANGLFAPHVAIETRKP